MKKAIASVGLLALGAAGVNTAQADWAAGADKPWSLSGTLRGFYDDNYNTQPSGAGRVGSFGFEVAPGASISYSAGPTVLKASYNYSLKYYGARPGNKIDQSHDFEFLLDHSFNERYKLDFTESFVDSQEPEVLQGTGPTTFPLRANGDNIRNTARLNFSAQITPLLGALVGYANSVYDYTGSLPANLVGVVAPYKTSLNRVEQTVTLDSRWTIDPETIGIFGYALSSVDYISGGNLIPVPGGPTAANPFVTAKTRNNYTHNVYVGVEHNFRSDLSFSGRAGVQISDYYNGQNAPHGSASVSDVGPYADLSLTYTYMENGSLTFGFRQSKNQTDVAPNADGSLTQDQESSTVYASVNQVLTPVSPNLTASLTGQYQHSIYNGGNTLNNLTDDFYLVGLNFTYQFTHYISGEFGYNYDLLQSAIPGRGYDRNRVYLGMTATY